jgi:hypothetical protein
MIILHKNFGKIDTKRQELIQNLGSSKEKQKQKAKSKKQKVEIDFRSCFAKGAYYTLLNHWGISCLFKDTKSIERENWCFIQSVKICAWWKL